MVESEVGGSGAFSEFPVRGQGVRHDSRWDPFGVRPFMTPAEYRVVGGVLDGFRRDNGWPAKSCHSVDVWPVICDYPTPVRKIEIEPEWLRKPEPDRPR